MFKKYSVFLMCFLFVNAALGAEAVGMFMSAKGDIKITSAGNTQPVKVGMKYFVGDIVVTGADGRAKITMNDRNNIFVSPNSTFKLGSYETGKNRNAEVILKEGKLRTELNNKYDDDKHKFQIKTPTAVAGVRGTDFVTSFDVASQTTEVLTIKGNVVLNNLAGNGKNVTVAAGQFSTVEAGSSPAPAEPASADKMNQAQQNFSVANNSPPPPPPAADTTTGGGQEPIKPDDKKGNGGDKKERTPTSDQPGAGSGANGSDRKGRVTDRQDQSPETFDRLPNADNKDGGSPDSLHSLPGANFNNQPGSTATQTNPVGGALQNQQPINVEINPTLPQ